MDELEEYERLVEVNGAPDAEVKPESTSGRSDKDRDRDRRGKERKRDRRSPSPQRERERDKRRDDADRPSSSSRRRSRSRERRHRSRERRPEYPRRDYERRDFDRGGRGRDRSRDGRAPRRRDPTPPELRQQREREREIRELERATRTLFAYNLNIKADERDIYDFFSKAGEVTDIRLITDRHTKRSKGLAYVEFSKQEELFVALALTGQVMLGQPVMVKPAEAEKNLAWEAAQAAKAGQAEQPDAALLGLGLGLGLDPLGGLAVGGAAAAVPQQLRLQVTGFKQGLTENEIRQIFEPFGAIDSVLVVRDGAGQPVSIAYVVFRSATDGHNALQHWHGKSLLDHVLAVSVAAPEALAGGYGGGGDDLDDDDFKLNTQTRAALMNRLASSAGMIQQPTAALAVAAAAAAAAGHPGLVAGALGVNPLAVNPLAGLPGMPAALAGGADLSLQQGLLGPPSPIPTQCLLLKNMFDPGQQSEPDWVADITEDVRDECAKYGGVLHVFVDKDSQGFVYLKFDGVAAAQAAAKVLHGRFYNGHMIQAAFQFVQIYDQHFGL